ncbi:MAG: glycoside hydrolase family 9 protein, partial [Lachnospiraceae bacterium]|nr:glycoside hydrolase family 9 protein [Lachnospiraceae bacterium]
GWHDAGDFDLRIESQTGEIYHLSAAVEEFNAFWDETTVDQNSKVVEIHQPDGKNDFLQQIEHGALSIVAGYKALGRLYHEIMCQNLRQYVLLGDPVNMTSHITDGPDERYVFTENNPAKELQSSARLAAAYRALKGYNDSLAKDCLDIAIALYDQLEEQNAVGKSVDDSGVGYYVRTDNTRIQAACELFLSTGEEKYRTRILGYVDYIKENVDKVGWCVCRCIDKLQDEAFKQTVKEALIVHQKNIANMCAETPYRIPYRPNTWGAGWGIQTMGAKYYFLHKAFPDVFPADVMYDALNFILGCHPGSNTASFASGIGAVSHTIAYGFNRADWSYIPGGVSSGTALIRPDFPELLEFPFLWQQSEYVIGGGSSDYLFLVLAVANTLKNK